MVTKRVLVVVKTYPHPSRSYQELVCTAGMLEDGSFIRLYPVDYRYRPSHQWYNKYQWVEVDVTRKNSDPRPESYRPNLDTIHILGQPLPTGNEWAERKKIVLAKPAKTMCELRSAYSQDYTSLGIVKPHRIADLRVKAVARDWKQSHQNALAQINLFDPVKKPLQKIPYKFSYQFFCDDQCRGHNMRITDWELGVLFLKEVERLGDEQKAVRSVRQMFFDNICGPNKDTHFFVGTTLPHNSWIVLGVFYPKKVLEVPKPKQTLPKSKQISIDF